jgi:23S rRNA pseudouridine1911/1915/1917 synthase
MDDALRPAGQEVRTLTVDSSGRVDVILAAAYPELSRARLQRLVAEGNVVVNGEPVRKSGRVGLGDSLTLTLHETPHVATETGLEFTRLYEDDAILAIDKPAGVAVHGAAGDVAPCVALWFLEQFPQAASAFDVERPGIVHRLDKDTSGVLLLAKTPQAQAAISAAFEARLVKKTYLAITDGVPQKPRAVIEAPIARHPADRMKMAVRNNGRPARTTYEVIASSHGRALVEVHPETGRTHQIRVHLAAINTPILDDRIYGRDHGPVHAATRVGCRQLLHAWQITFPHPDGEEVTITAPPPPDIVDAIRDLGAPEVTARYA